MKSFGLLVLLLLVLCVLCQLVLPWWSVVPVGLAVGAWRGRTGGCAFLTGLLGTGLSWWIPALWLNAHGAERLAIRLATLLPIGGNPWVLALISGLLVGLVGGLATLSGIWLRQAFMLPAEKRVVRA